ncbi:MAG: hypothetical protein JXA78_05565 [Anaerolineales bacterium]|nr:hypothetical protein [Anaerolineales bacterium]
MRIGKLLREPGAVIRYARQEYDVPHFIDRVVENSGNLRLTVYLIKNQQDVDLSCYVKFAAVFEKAVS